MTAQERIDLVTQDIKIVMAKYGMTDALFFFKEITTNRGLLNLHTSHVPDPLIKAVTEILINELKEDYGTPTVDNKINNPNTN